jgi:hypothetical protein
LVRKSIMSGYPFEDSYGYARDGRRGAWRGRNRAAPCRPCRAAASFALHFLERLARVSEGIDT